MLCILEFYFWFIGYFVTEMAKVCNHIHLKLYCYVNYFYILYFMQQINGIIAYNLQLHCMKHQYIFCIHLKLIFCQLQIGAVIIIISLKKLYVKIYCLDIPKNIVHLLFVNRSTFPFLRHLVTLVIHPSSADHSWDCCDVADELTHNTACSGNDVNQNV